MNDAPIVRVLGAAQLMNSEIHKFGGVGRPAFVSLRRDMIGLFLARRTGVLRAHWSTGRECSRLCRSTNFYEGDLNRGVRKT